MRDSKDWLTLGETIVADTLEYVMLSGKHTKKELLEKMPSYRDLILECWERAQDPDSIARYQEAVRKHELNSKKDVQ